MHCVVSGFASTDNRYKQLSILSLSISTPFVKVYIAYHYINSSLSCCYLKRMSLRDQFANWSWQSVLLTKKVCNCNVLGDTDCHVASLLAMTRIFRKCIAHKLEFVLFSPFGKKFLQKAFQVPQNIVKYYIIVTAQLAPPYNSMR